MSVVLAVCGNNFFKIMSDGRLVKFENLIPFDAEKFTVANETHPKVIKVAEHWAAGIAGSGDIAFSLFDEINKRPAYKKLPLEKILFKIKNKLKTYRTPPIKTTVFVGGVDSQNQCSLSILRSDKEYEIEQIVPRHNEFAIKGVFPSTIDGETILENRICNHMPFRDIEHVDLLMRNCIEGVAEINRSVNKVIFEELIVLR